MPEDDDAPGGPGKPLEQHEQHELQQDEPRRPWTAGPGRRDHRTDGSGRNLAIAAGALLAATAIGVSFDGVRGGSSSWPPAQLSSPVAVATSGRLSGPVLDDLSAAGVDTVSINAMAGQLTVTASGSAEVSDAGSSRPLFYQLDSATHTLQLFCPGSGSCATGDYVVTIPEHVGLVLHQVSGQTTLSGLSGPVDIIASSVSVNAVELDTASFTASITSGQLNAAFTVAPRRTVLTVVSADTTLNLPATASYDVVQHVTSGNVDIAVPQSPDAQNVIDTTVVSGEISVTDG